MSQTSPEVGPGRKKIKQLEVMVAGVIEETPDTTTLVLFTGNDALEYKAGHFCTIDPHQFPALGRWTQYLEDSKGRREAPRAYSLTSAPHEKRLAITVKEECYLSGATPYPPLLSPVLVRWTPPGTHMVVTGFTGPYHLPDDIESKANHLVHICAGSGIVPNYAIIKHALHNELKLRHTLIYGNKSWDDIIFNDALRELAGQHPERLEIIHCLSRDPDAASHGRNVRAGRVTDTLLKEIIHDPSAAQFFVCGPGLTKWDRKVAKDKGLEPEPRFLESTLSALASMGVREDRIHEESYG